MFSKPLFKIFGFRKAVAKCQQAWLLSLACMVCTPAFAFPEEPTPWRRMQALEGREVLYNKSSFIHRFHYRANSDAPRAGSDGLWGTLGSVSSDEQFSRLRLQDTLQLDTLGWLSYRALREEDHDGRYERLLIGAGIDLQHHRIAWFADAPGDKAEVTLQGEWRWQPISQIEWRAALLLPDILFNRKTAENAEFTRYPLGYFVALDIGTATHWYWQLAVNATPDAAFKHHDLGVAISAHEIHWGAALHTPIWSNSRWVARLANHHVKRTFTPLRTESKVSPLRRRSWEAEFSWQWQANQPRSAQLGYRFFRFEETGFFGWQDKLTGVDYHREHLWFIEYPWQLAERLTLQPMLSVTRLRSLREVENTDLDERNNRQWFSKLSLPFYFLLNEQKRGVITLAPSFYLHKVRFGGGNVQVQWYL